MADPGAEERLERQRTDVRAATARLQRAATTALTGIVRTSTSGFRGCESGGLEEFKSFRYLAEARIDVTGDTPRPYLDRMPAALEEAGFTPDAASDRPGGRSLRASAGELSASVSELPGQGDHVLLSVAGPCIDVPEADRDAWLRREEPVPEIG